MARKISVADQLNMTSEQRAELHFREKEREYNKQWDVVNSLKDNDPKQFEAQLKIDKLMQEMFRSFDNWQHHIKNRFTAPQADVKQLLYDVLMANFECLPDAEEKEKLEKRWHTLEVCDDLISALKEWGVAVRERESDAAPMCPDCEQELSA